MADAENKNKKQTTLIAADTDVKGEMSFDDNCRILGHFEGTITASGELQIAEGAACKAQVEAETVIVDGKIEGNITAKDKVTLNASAEVRGDITAAKLSVAEGAVLEGQLAIGGKGASTESKPPAGSGQAGEASDKPARQGGGSTPTSAGHGAPRQSTKAQKLSNAPSE